MKSITDFFKIYEDDIKPTSIIPKERAITNPIPSPPPSIDTDKSPTQKNKKTKN